MAIFSGTRNFIGDVRAEFKKVSWPSWGETKNSTGVVLVVTIFVAAFLGAVDMGLSEAVKLIIK